MALLFEVAMWTGILQGVFMAILLVGAPIWFFTDFRVGRVKRQAELEQHSSAAPKVRLEPLKCTQCGAGLAMEADCLRCVRCGTTSDEPAEYRSILDDRRKTLVRMEQASKYLKRATALSSGWVRWGLILAGVWLFCVPFILVALEESNPKYEPMIQSVGNWSAAFVVTLILWEIVLFFTAANLTKVRMTLPEMPSGESLAHAETGNCRECAGELIFHAGDLAGICGYCGVQTLRNEVVWRVSKHSKEQTNIAGKTLFDAQMASAEVWEELVGTPATLIFIFIYLPLIFVVPYMLWEWIKEHPGQTAVALVGVIVVVAVIARLRPTQPADAPRK